MTFGKVNNSYWGIMGNETLKPFINKGFQRFGFAFESRRLDQIRNSRLIQPYQSAVSFIVKNELKVLVNQGLFSFVVHFGVCSAYILYLG